MGGKTGRRKRGRKGGSLLDQLPVFLEILKTEFFLLPCSGAREQYHPMSDPQEERFSGLENTEGHGPTGGKARGPS